MSNIECFYCKSIGTKGVFKRFIKNGIHYECGTNECDLLKKQKQQEIIELDRKIANEKLILQQTETRKKWGDYIYEHENDFIIAEKQYRDACQRSVDPYSLKIFKYSFIEKDWCETNDTLTTNDMKNVRKRRKELVMQGKTFDDIIDSSESEEELNECY
jgi:hypothetical protein